MNNNKNHLQNQQNCSGLRKSSKENLNPDMYKTTFHKNNVCQNIDKIIAQTEINFKDITNTQSQNNFNKTVQKDNYQELVNSISNTFKKIQQKLDINEKKKFKKQGIKFESDKQTPQEFLNFFEIIISSLIKDKKDLGEYLDQKDEDQSNEYEEYMQKLEADIREHISLEQQLRLYQESTQSKLDDCEKELLSFKNHNNFERECKKQQQENEILKQKIQQFEQKINQQDQKINQYEQKIHQLQQKNLYTSQENLKQFETTPQTIEMQTTRDFTSQAKESLHKRSSSTLRYQGSSQVNKSQNSLDVKQKLREKQKIIEKLRKQIDECGNDQQQLDPVDYSLNMNEIQPLKQQPMEKKRTLSTSNQRSRTDAYSNYNPIDYVSKYQRAESNKYNVIKSSKNLITNKQKEYQTKKFDSSSQLKNKYN